VNEPNFRHPEDLVCTLDSQFGCFYEKPSVINNTGNQLDIKTDTTKFDTTKSDTNTRPKRARTVKPAPQKEKEKDYTGLIRRPRIGPDQKLPRCSSPSHFLLGYDEHFGGGDSRLAMKSRIDSYLFAVAKIFYRPHAAIDQMNQSDKTSEDEVRVSSAYDRYEYPTLDSLLSSLRKSTVFDEWTPREVALFECGICAFGKEFHRISALMGSKSTQQCTEFYYHWKKSTHYQMWKTANKPINKKMWNKAKQEQWEKIRQIMSRMEPNHFNNNQSMADDKKSTENKSDKENDSNTVVQQADLKAKSTNKRKRGATIGDVQMTA